MEGFAAVSSYISYPSLENHPTNCPLGDMALATHFDLKTCIVYNFVLYTKPGGRRSSTISIDNDCNEPGSVLTRRIPGAWCGMGLETGGIGMLVREEERLGRGLGLD